MGTYNLTSSNLFDLTYSVFDFETTGGKAINSKAIELGIVKIKSGKVIETFNSLFDPQSIIPPFIENLTGISSEEVIGQPLFEDRAEEILDFFNNSILVAHNLPFDLSFLKTEMKRSGIDFPEMPAICTLKLSRRLFKDLSKKSLGSLVEHFGIKHDSLHRALGDAMATSKILYVILHELSENYSVKSFDELMNFYYGTKHKIKYAENNLTKSMGYDIPNKPGNYFFKDNDGNIIYVGKSNSLNIRVKSYFSTNANEKQIEIVNNSSQLEIEPTNTELLALIKEAESIKKFNPIHNIKLKGFSDVYFIKIDINSKYPEIKSTMVFHLDDADYFGPYVGKKTISVLIESINRNYMLRECSKKEFLRKKGCYLIDLGRCLAPCINDVSDEYLLEINKVYSLLEGKNEQLISGLTFKMKSLSDQLKFEEALEIKNLIERFLKQIKRTSLIKTPINKSEVLLKIRGYQNNDLILINKGKVIIKNYDVSNQKFKEETDFYYNGVIELFNERSEKEIERLRIILGWLAKNRKSVSVYYLSDYKNSEELFSAIN